MNTLMPRRGLLLIILCLLPLMAVGQERLEPLKVVSIAPVPKDTTRYEHGTPEYWFHITDTPKLDFFECRGDTGVVGYLMKTADSVHRHSFESSVKGHLLDDAGLPEVQRAEVVLAEVLNLRADSAQRIAEVFTAPRSYRFTRQYIIYLNSMGDTCAFVNCLMADEDNFPDRSFIIWNDGDDNYWHIKLNLTRRQLLDADINGPMIVWVDGRSKEPHGLDSLTVFGWMGGDIQYFDCDVLPKAVRSHLPKEYHIDGMTQYDGFTVNGNKYYTISYSSGTEVGFDNHGRWLFLYKKDSLTQEELVRMTGSTRIYEAVVKDMAARGRDFPRYGWIQAVERVKGCFVVEVKYYPSNAPGSQGNTADMYARYTIDKKGRVIGIVH